MNLRERHSHVFKDPRKTERCDAAQLLAAGDALVEACRHLLDAPPPQDALSGVLVTLAKWKKATDG